jgi:long-chain fatty acid transport protein
MNQCSTLRVLAVAAVLAGLPLMLRANAFRLADQDAFATARGEAFVATADNPSAIYYNPAGIAQLEGLNLRAGVYGLYFSPTFSRPGGGETYNIAKHYAGVPQAFYTYTPDHSPLSFGLGVYSPYGLSVSWPEDTGFRAVALRSSLKYFRINPVMALKVAPNFSLGAGLMVNYSQMKLEQGLSPFYLPPRTNYFRFNGDGWSVGYNLGLLWQPHEKVSLGATYRSAAAVTLAGHTVFEDFGSVEQTRRGAKMDLTFPMTAVFGVSYRPTPKWNVEFDADYTDWSCFDSTTIRQHPSPPPPVQQNIPVMFNWQPSWMYSLGATRYFDNAWHVSAGYVFNENSVPNAYYTPLVADMDRHFFSVGTGLTGRRYNFDLTYQFGYGPAHTVTGSSASSQPGEAADQNGNGTYDFISHAVMLTVGLHF